MRFARIFTCVLALLGFQDAMPVRRGVLTPWLAGYARTHFHG